ncbi:MAG: hypothetical protein ACYSWP_11935 [Planctomycetota bacterium]
MPKRLRIKGDQEMFRIEVKFDTGELYGTITVSQKIVISKD